MDRHVFLTQVSAPLERYSRETRDEQNIAEKDTMFPQLEVLLAELLARQTRLPFVIEFIAKSDPMSC